MLNTVWKSLRIFILPAVLVLGMSSCTTTGSDRAELFPPAPQPQVAQNDLPMQRPVTDLLRDAEKAFQKANKAQERGNQEEAMRHYTLMLELLVEAELDPSIFYSLRNEFGGILEQGTKHAKAYHHHHQEQEYVPAEGSEFGDIKVPVPLPERVIHILEKIQGPWRTSFQTALDRSHMYTPYITAELDKAGLPRELVYVAMIESHFKDSVNSRAGAGGMWQFMRPSGRRFDLRIDSYVDERYDWQSSTRAGIEYLTVLYDMFEGNWPLAITAYNMGEGGVSRAMAANGGEDNLWKLVDTPPASNRIRLETKEYFPKFLAYWMVCSNPERYGFTVKQGPAQELIHVPVKGMYALDDLDESMGFPNGTLARLNPDLIREVTPPTGSYHLSVPPEYQTKLASALKTTKTLSYSGGSYKVKRGDTISGIASLYGVSQRELMRVNHIRSARSLRIGQTLQIPGGGTGRGGSVASSDGIYTVKSGDTLSTIAQRHGTTVKNIQNWNGMGRSTNLRIGQKLSVGRTATASASSSGNTSTSTASTSTHTVKAGEYPAKIAKQYGVSVNDLLAWNGLNKNSTIKIGQKLSIRGGSSSTASAPRTESLTHTVVRGDTASGIASKYGVKTNDLLAWNNLSKRSTLKVGQKLTVKAPRVQVASNNKVTHTVAKGNNPTSIARRYGVKVNDLYKWNSWSKNHVLQIGDKVVVYK